MVFVVLGGALVGLLLAAAAPRLTAACISRLVRKSLASPGLNETARGLVRKCSEPLATNILASIVWNRRGNDAVNDAFHGLMLRQDFNQAFAWSQIGILGDEAMRVAIKQSVLEGLHDAKLHDELRRLIVDCMHDKELRSIMLHSANAFVKETLREALEDNELRTVIVEALGDLMKDPAIRSLLIFAMKSNLMDEDLHSAIMHGVAMAWNPLAGLPSLERESRNNIMESVRDALEEARRPFESVRGAFEEARIPFEFGNTQFEAARDAWLEALQAHAASRAGDEHIADGERVEIPSANEEPLDVASRLHLLVDGLSNNEQANSLRLAWLDAAETVRLRVSTAASSPLQSEENVPGGVSQWANVFDGQANPLETLRESLLEATRSLMASTGWQPASQDNPWRPPTSTEETNPSQTFVDHLREPATSFRVRAPSRDGDVKGASSSRIGSDGRLERVVVYSSSPRRKGPSPLDGDTVEASFSRIGSDCKLEEDFKCRSVRADSDTGDILRGSSQRRLVCSMPVGDLWLRNQVFCMAPRDRNQEAVDVITAHPPASVDSLRPVPSPQLPRERAPAFEPVPPSTGAFCDEMSVELPTLSASIKPESNVQQSRLRRSDIVSI